MLPLLGVLLLLLLPSLRVLDLALQLLPPLVLELLVPLRLLLPKLFDLAGDELLLLLVFVVAPPRAAQQHRRAVKPDPVLLALGLRGAGLVSSGTAAAVPSLAPLGGVAAFALDLRAAGADGCRGLLSARRAVITLRRTLVRGTALTVSYKDGIDLRGWVKGGVEGGSEREGRSASTLITCTRYVDGT